MKPIVQIFTDAVGRDKTTFLGQWIKTQQAVGGVLSPKIEGKRFFQMLRSGELLPMEASEGNLEIGNYVFNQENFQKVSQQIWNDYIDPILDTIVIDEIGPLEIKKKQGFHELLLKIREYPLQHKKTLLLIVRDYCIQDFIETYHFEDLKVLTQYDLELPLKQRPIGLVLCGGKSERMHTDKALIDYHGMPQWEYVVKLLQPLCEKVYVALNEQQASKWIVPSSIGISVDKEIYNHHGPMTALLSAKDILQGQPFFVVACDYPLVGITHLIQLAMSRDKNIDVVCFTTEGQIEPLISLFEKGALSKLTSFFEAGNDSIFKFITQLKFKGLTADDDQFLRNVNSQHEMVAVKKQINT